MTWTLLPQWITAASVIVGAIAVFAVMYANLGRLEQANRENLSAHEKIAKRLGLIETQIAVIAAKSVAVDSRLARVEHKFDEFTGRH